MMTAREARAVKRRRLAMAGASVLLVMLVTAAAGAALWKLQLLQQWVR
jgi:hypothetical protein